MHAFTVLRWFVSRLFEPDDATNLEKRKVEFAVTQESADGIPEQYKTPPRKLIDTASDNLDWWNDDEELELNGYIPYNQFYESFIKNNVGQDSSGITVPATQRRINEGMVFLQIIQSSKAKDMEKLWGRLVESEKIPDLAELAGLEDSVWLDFTRQARKMMASLYKEVLGDKEGTKNESK
jgi:hypothetical protein